MNERATLKKSLVLCVVCRVVLCGACVKRKRFGLGSSNYAETVWQRLRTTFGSFPFELKKKRAVLQHINTPWNLSRYINSWKSLPESFPMVRAAPLNPINLWGGAKFDLIGLHKCKGGIEA
jgi:hypothetical protein